MLQLLSYFYVNSTFTTAGFPWMQWNIMKHDVKPERQNHLLSFSVYSHCFEHEDSSECDGVKDSSSIMSKSLFFSFQDYRDVLTRITFMWSFKTPINVNTWITFTILSSGSLPSQRSLLPSGIETSYDFSQLQPLHSYIVNSRLKLWSCTCGWL